MTNLLGTRAIGKTSKNQIEGHICFVGLTGSYLHIAILDSKTGRIHVFQSSDVEVLDTIKTLLG